MNDDTSSGFLLSTSSRMTWCRARLKKSLPIAGLLSSGYKTSDVFSDALAGFTVGLSVIPQSIAFATIAELPPEYGLYASFMGPFVYVVLGSVPAVTIGPTTLMALMIQKYVQIHPGYAPFLALCNGAIILVCGILRLGFLIDFVSTPVISAYTSAASLTIGCNQIKSLFGLTITKKSELPGMLKTMSELFSNISSIRWQDTTLGIASIILLLIFKALPSMKCLDGMRNDFYKRWSKTSTWIMSIGRNAFVVILFSIVAYSVDGKDPDSPTFILTGNIVGGLPQFDLPPFGINRTSTIEDPTIGDIFAEAGSVLATLPMICILCHIAIAKAFAKSGRVDATQEMLALGTSNLLGSFFKSMPVSGSFGRTAVNAASGVKTPLGGIVTGSVVLLSLAVLMPYCAFIPKTTLAAVIICAVIFSVDYQIVVPIWKSKRIDLLPAFITFIGCLFWSLEYGILVGIGTNLVLVLYHAARPKISYKLLQASAEEAVNDQLWITLDHGWSFPATSHIRNKIEAMLLNHVTRSTDDVISDVSRNPVTIVLDFVCVDFLDFTSANAIRDLISHYSKIGHQLVIYQLQDSLLSTLVNAKQGTLTCTFAKTTAEIYSQI